MTNPFIWGAGTANNGLYIPSFNLLTTEIESLTTGSIVVSSVGGTSGLFSVTQTGQAVLAELFFSFGNPGVASALSNGACITGWFLPQANSTVFESKTLVNSRNPDFIVPLPATTIPNTPITPFKALGPVILPALPFFVMIQNNTGRTTGNGGTTPPYLVCAPYTVQY